MYRTERNNLINILNSMQDGVYIVNQHYDVEYANPALIRLFGSFEGKKCFEYSHNRSQICPCCKINEVLKGMTIRSEFFYDKHQKMYDLIDTPLKKSDGSIAFLRIFRDITEKKEAEENVKESEKRFRILSESSPAAIMIYQNYQCIYANPAAEYITEYKINELLTMKFWDFLHPVFKNIAIEGGKAIERGEIPRHQAELKVLTKSGKERWIDARLELIEYQGKRASLIIALDITKRKQIEMELKRSDSENKAILSANPDLIFEFDKDGIYQIVKGNIKDLYLPPEELLGKKVTDLLPKDIGLLAIEKINKTLKTGETQTFEYVLSIAEEQRYWEARMTISREDRVMAVIREITNKKITEQKLKESEEKYSAIVKSFDGLIYICSQDYKVEFMNEKFLQRTGYDGVGDFCYKALHNLDNICPWCVNDRVFKGETVKWKILSPKDNRWYYIVNTPINHLDGTISKIAMILDITEQIEAEVSLKESEERYRLITENAHDLIALVNQKYEHEFINENTYMNVLGYSNKDMLGKNRFEIIHPDDLERAVNAYKNGFLTGEGTVELRLRHKQGHYLWFEIKGKSYQDAEGNVKGLLISRNITERKHAEEKFRTITEKSLLGIVILQDNIIKYINERMAEMYGYTVEEVLGWKPGEFIKIYTPEQHDFILEQGRKNQLGLPNAIQKYQIKAIKKSGEIFWVDNYSKTIIYDGRSADLVTQIDITEKKRAEEELISLNKLKSELLTRYSHELKTPLMSIKGFTDLLLLKFQDVLHSEELSLVDEIKNGCFRLETLIRNILNSAELDSGTVMLELVKNDLCSVIRSCVKELTGFARSRDHAITLNLHDKILTTFDSKQIQQVINNILTNAIKYTPPKGIITIQSEIKDNLVILSFKDTGIGFTKQEKNQIFTCFGKIERFGQGFDVITEGTGLGLYISKKIIELHGGKLWMESEGRDRGSTFYFTLPLI